MVLSQALAPLLDLVYPPRCPGCGAALAGHGGLCATCFAGLVIPGVPACRLCHRVFTGAVGEDSLCDACARAAPAHHGIAAGTVYNPGSRQLVLAYKHGRQLTLAPLMARLIAARMNAHWHADAEDPAHAPVDAGWHVVPVPLHRWRLWRRGFNQSALLAGELAKLTGASLLVDGLVRHRATPSLGGLNAEERLRAVSGTIAVNPRHGATFEGAHVLLVDDVVTSGATTGACIAALRGAGAARVRIACFARVMDEQHGHASDERKTPGAETPGVSVTKFVGAA